MNLDEYKEFFGWVGCVKLFSNKIDYKLQIFMLTNWKIYASKFIKNMTLQLFEDWGSKEISQFPTMNILNEKVFYLL